MTGPVSADRIVGAGALLAAILAPFYLSSYWVGTLLTQMLFLGIVAVAPFFLQQFTSVQALTLSSTGLLIVVGVVLDTIKQLEAQLLMRNYRGFIR